MRPGRPPRLPNGAGEWCCSRCREWLPASAYHGHNTAVSGLQSACRACVLAGRKGYYARHTPERRLELLQYRRGWYLRRAAARMAARTPPTE